MPSAFLLPDGSIHIQSRHSGVTHHTIIGVRMLVNNLPITKALKAEVLGSLKGGA